MSAYKDRVMEKTLNIYEYTADDGGMMDAWLERYGKNWIHIPQLRAWYRWTGSHWEEEKTGGAGRQIQYMLSKFNEQLRFSMNGQEEEEQKKIKAYISATRRSRSRVNSIEGMAENELGQEARYLDRLDVLNFRNGTLDIDNLTMREHRREDLITDCLPYEFDFEAEAPAWRDYLKHLPDDCVSFLQEFAGYSLTTNTEHEIAVWLYGPPGSGKSTFISGIQEALGYRTGILSLSAIENDRFALATIPGKTLLVSTEQPAMHMRATHVINAIISGERVMVDQKYKDAYPLDPTAKLLWAMNRFPIVNDTNDGIFRRVKVVKFKVVHNKKPDLKKAFAEERAGILNWVIEGYMRFNDRGYFEIPDSVKQATEEFIDENDIVRTFVKENCAIGPDYEEASSALHEAFTDWCNENEFKPMSPYKLAQEWKRLGFEKYKAPTGMRWTGIRLL